MAAKFLLDVREAQKRFGGLLAVDHADLAVETGSITGLIGPNGAGKTTLFALISGHERLSGGAIRFDGRDIAALPPHRRARLGIARTFQIVKPFAGLSVKENIAVGAYLRRPDRASALVKADEIVQFVGLKAMAERAASTLTVSARKRLELGRALATEPKLLLLDEILAGLTPSEVRDILPIIGSIRANGVTILLVEHVMQAVMSLCDTVHVIARGRMIAAGSPQSVTADKLVVEAYLGARTAARLGGELKSAGSGG